jgi:hypothetical protein
MYNRKNDASRVSSADLSDEDLHDEVRRLTCFGMKDTIVLTSARSPYDLKHLPAKVIFTVFAFVITIVLLLNPSLIFLLPAGLYRGSVLSSHTREWSGTRG